MKLENKVAIKLSLQNIANIEKLNHALPTLTQPEKRDLMSNEPTQIYYAHWESFRRTCEARAVLRWIAGAYFENKYHPIVDECYRTDHSILCFLPMWLQNAMDWQLPSLKKICWIYFTLLLSTIHHCMICCFLS